MLALMAAAFALADSPTKTGDTFAGTTGTSPRSLSTRQLIDKLTEAREGAVEVNDWIRYEGTDIFIVYDRPPDPDRIEPPPPIPPALRELVARGTDSLPELIKHLNDGRETKLRMVTHGYEVGEEERELGLSYYGPNFMLDIERQYDPRFSDRAKHPEGVETSYLDSLPPAAFVPAYTVTVSDLCYVAVGQIVNRNLVSLGYAGENSYDINSPIAQPALANAVRRDWAGLSAAEHFKSLGADARTPDDLSAHAVGAVRRLGYYYPRESEAVFVELLSRSLYDETPVIDTLFESMLRTDDAAEWQASFDRFRKEYGDTAATGLLFYLTKHCTEMEEDAEFLSKPGAEIGGSKWGRNKDDFERSAKLGRKMLALLTARFPDHPPFEEVASTLPQIDVIYALSAYASPKVDEAVHRVFLRAKEIPNVDERSLELIAEACLDRLKGTPYEPAYREFLGSKNP